MRTMIAQRIQRRALAMLTLCTYKKMSRQKLWAAEERVLSVVSVGRGKSQQHEAMAAVMEDPGFGGYGISSYYSTLCEEGKQSRGTWQREAKDSEEKKKTEGKECTVFFFLIVKSY